MFKSLITASLALAITAIGFSQENPYTELAQREIKALSSQQIEDYEAGRGMGFALSAELNNYPGPKHVLELKEVLNLSETQHAQIQALFNSMQSAAKELGRKIVSAERALDAEFAKGTISDEKLEKAVVEIGRLNGKLRWVHLSSHLETRNVLTKEQAETYAVQRGYKSGNDPGKHHGH